MIVAPYIEINQPIGSFYFSKMKATDLGQIVNVTPRSASPSAIQRDESSKRINEIANYCSDPDATFPTPIIISIYEDANIIIKNNQFEIPFDSNKKIGEVIDGQHRLKGILKSSYKDRFELPVIFMFNLTEEEKAYVFSIINSKQTKVSMSLIYDLFALSKHRSPQKTAHEIARALNKNTDSPFYNRLKMLGKKEENQDLATLSQGTFVKHLITLLTKDPDLDYRLSKKNEKLMEVPSLPLREYFLNNEDGVILKILLNVFNALRDTFPEYWESPLDNILWKSTGYVAILNAFNTLYDLGDSQNDLTYSHFKKCFISFRDYLDKEGLVLTSKDFPSNAQQQNRLSKILIESTKTVYRV
jgi:DGQHR domain-containing protein